MAYEGVSCPNTAFASVTHPNSFTGQTGLLGLDNLFGITDSNFGGSQVRKSALRLRSPMEEGSPSNLIHLFLRDKEIELPLGPESSKARSLQLLIIGSYFFFERSAVTSMKSGAQTRSARPERSPDSGPSPIDPRSR